MQYTVAPMPPGFDPGPVTDLLTAADPAALVDLDGSGSILRLATLLEVGEIASVLSAAGVPMGQSDIVRVPSECCGGCGG